MHCGREMGNSQGDTNLQSVYFFSKYECMGYWKMRKDFVLLDPFSEETEFPHLRGTRSKGDQQTNVEMNAGQR